MNSLDIKLKKVYWILLKAFISQIKTQILNLVAILLNKYFVFWVYFIYFISFFLTLRTFD